MVSGGRGHIGNRAVANARICMEVSGNHCGVHCGTSNLLVLYWGRAGSGFQSEPEMLGAGPQPGGGGQ